MTVSKLSTLPPVPAAPPSLMTEREFCARTRLSPAHVQAMRRKGTGPQFVRIGKAVRYPEVAVSDWLAALSAQR
jgi:predicted DNA-binding transcriptional regulator AlpA